MGAEQSPRIVIVDESPIRAAILEEGLRESGYTEVVHLSEMQSLLAVGHHEERRIGQSHAESLSKPVRHRYLGKAFR